jgi:HAD superfamily hydrolase (TIGR01509 family)
MTRLKALLWDVDGTMAETERHGHRVAFNLAFEACGLPWRWDEAHYGGLLRITGGRERLMHDMSLRSDAPALAGEREALARAVHAKKNGIYADLVRGAGIPLRDGVSALMRQCRDRGLHMGIATTTSRSNVDALLRAHLGGRWAEWFPAVVCGEDVQEKKPHPQVYLQALRALGIGPLEAVALEDSPGGAAAARAADIPVVVTRSAYFSDAPIDGAVAIGPGLHDRSGWRPALDTEGAAGGQGVGLHDIEGWCARMDWVSCHPWSR